MAIDIVVKDRATFDPTQKNVVADPSAIQTGDPCQKNTLDRGNRGYGGSWVRSSPTG